VIEFGTLVSVSAHSRAVWGLAACVFDTRAWVGAPSGIRSRRWLCAASRRR